jgi:heme A synthase
MNSENIIGMGLGQHSEGINILLLLVIFWYLFDKMITKMGFKAEGYSWLMVVFGVVVTQIGAGMLDLILNWNALFVGGLAYTASGLPIIRGAILRHLEEKERAHKAAQNAS